jgi:microcystin-dependent protein
MNKKNNALHLAAGAALATAAMLGGTNAQACGGEPYLGQVCMSAANFCPKGYAEANGQQLPISSNQALFALMGTQYGGNGTTTFAVPDLRGSSAIGWGQGSGLTPVQQGQKRGAESSKLNVTNLPSHSHGARAVNATGTSTAADNSWPANSATTASPPVVNNDYAASGSEVTLNSGVIGATGSNTPVTNLPPQLGMRYCIATQGLFPSRN